MIEPNIRIELTLHPDAKDGSRNAWLIEMIGADGLRVLAQAANTPQACLDIAKEFLAAGNVEQGFRVPPGVVRLVTGRIVGDVEPGPWSEPVR